MAEPQVGQPLDPNEYSLGSPSGQPNQATGAPQVGQPLDPNAYGFQAPSTGASPKTPDVGPSPVQAGFDKVKDLAKGAGEAFMGTVGGLGSIVDKVNKAVGSPLPPLSDEAKQHMSNLQGNDHTMNTMEKVGYGGETLLEFLMGDEALKGLSFADKLSQSAKTAKLLEQSPKLMSAVKVGAAKIAEQSARAAVVQGGQTLARTGGNVKEAVKSGLTTGAIAAPLAGVGEAVSSLGGKAVEGAEASNNLTNTAKAAITKPETADLAQDYVEKSKEALHQNYEKTINDLTGRAKGTTIDPVQEPSLGGAHPEMSNRATELLKNPVPSDHQLVSDTKSITGEKLDGSVKNLLRKVQTGYNDPDAFDSWSEQQKGINSGKLTQVDKKVYDTAAYNKWQSEQGQNLEGQGTGSKIAEPKSQEALKEPEKLEPYDLDQLIKLRQEVRKAAQAYEPGNINSRTLVGKGSLTQGIDDTIGQLAAKVPDPTLSSEYNALRNDYASKINIYDSPVVKQIRAGKYDDVSKAILSGNTSQYKINDLRTILGDDKMDDLAHKVFGNMLQDSQDATGQVNAAKLVRTWAKLPDETKENLFKPQNAGQDIANAMKDAKVARNIQYLTRVGVITPAAVAGGQFTHLGLLGVLLTEGAAGGGAITKVGDLLDYIANHPNTWKGLKATGEAVQSPAAATIGRGVIGAVGQATMPNKTNNTASKRTVYNSARGMAGNE